MKVVLAAAMWNSPHMLVLDEPTNYLDRESLGALAAAIKTYGGGVVMISHHSGEASVDPVLTSAALQHWSSKCGLLMSGYELRGTYHVICTCYST